MELEADSPPPLPLPLDGSGEAARGAGPSALGSSEAPPRRWPCGLDFLCLLFAGSGEATGLCCCCCSVL